MAAFERIHNFLHKNMSLVVGGALIVGSFAKVWPEAYGLDKLKKKYGRVSVNNPNKIEKLDKTTENLVDKVLFRMNLHPREEEGIQMFVCKGQDPVHRGTLKLGGGAIIGFPKSFQYKTEEDVEQSDLTVQGLEYIDWSSGAGRALKEAILLTEREKAFAIAKEIYNANFNVIYVHQAAVMFIGFGGYVTGSFIALVKKFRSRFSIWTRISFYSVVGLATLWVFLFAIRKYDDFCEVRADYKAAKMNYYYATGAVEYYDKLLQRNRALRTLLGTRGEMIYSEDGDVIHSEHPGWKPGLPLTERRDRLDAFLEQMEYTNRLNEETQRG